MRLFRFGNVTHLNVLVAVCGTGPFSPSELKETVGRMQRVLQLMKNDFVNRDVEQSNFWSQLGETRTVAMGAGATAHIFTVAAPPLGYLPTAVVITARQDASFVVQLLIVPDGVQKILSLSNMNDSVETLVKDLYPRLK